MSNKWEFALRGPQDTYYGIANWQRLNAKTRVEARQEADRWLNEQIENGLYLNYHFSCLEIAKENSDYVDSFRWIDESEWVRSGEGSSD